MTGTQTGTPNPIAAGQTAAGANSAYLICRAQMGAAANTFYAQPSTQNGVGAGGGLSFVYQQGNRNLKSEVADTWTAGVVLQSPFEHELLRRITATVDWYQIAINDTILQYTMDYARYLCYGTVLVSDAAAAAAQAASAPARRIPAMR